MRLISSPTLGRGTYNDEGDWVVEFKVEPIASDKLMVGSVYEHRGEYWLLEVSRENRLEFRRIFQ